MSPDPAIAEGLANVIPEMLDELEEYITGGNRAAALIKATEVVEEHGKPTTKSEVQYLGSLYRKTIESLCPQLFGATTTGVSEEPQAEPSGTSSVEPLQPAPSSFRSPRYSSGRDAVSITFEEAARLQTGFSSPVYLLVYPPEGRGVYVGSWIRVQERYPSAVGEATTLGEGRRWLIREGFPERYFDAI